MFIRNLRFPLLWITLAGINASALAGEAWPEFRGPNQQGWSDTPSVPLTWGEGEHVRWKTALPGEGWSSPVVADGRIWMTTALEGGKSLRALSADLTTGKLLLDVEVFRNEVVPEKHARNSYASPSPIIRDGRVYVHFGAMGTAALDAKTGRKIWENRDLRFDPQNGPGGSPALDGDKLLIACDGIDAQYEAALDAATGKVAWRTERSAIPKLAVRPADMRKAYGTPVELVIDGRRQSLCTAAERLYAYDPFNGNELWHVDYPGFSNVPLPAWNAHLLVTTTGFGKPALWGIRLGGAQGDVTATHVLWKQKGGAPAQSSPLLIGDRVYMVSDSGIASCLNAGTGAVVWKQRIGSDFAASPLYAAGRIYFFDCKGDCTVIKPGDTFETLAKNHLDDGFMASPAVIGKALILRTKSSLYRVEE